MCLPEQLAVCQRDLREQIEERRNSIVTCMYSALYPHWNMERNTSSVYAGLMRQHEVPTLHDVACGISMSLETQAVSPDRTGRSGILHVSGTPFLKRKQAGYMGDSISSSLCPFQLCQVGRRLECAWNTVLGQGGYAKVFYGQVRAFLTFEVGYACADQ